MNGRDFLSVGSGTSSFLIGPGWSDLVSRLGRGTVLVIGKPGRGKSSLVRYLLERLAPRGGRVGLLSTDMGQASVGVPTCLGLSLDSPWHKPAALWFIGDTVPTGHLLQTVGGAVRLARRARGEGAETLVIDTNGLVDGPVGRVLKFHKALAVGVDHVVALQQGEELEPLLALLEGVCPAVHRLAPVAAARDRSPMERKLYREALWQAHLEGGEVLTFPTTRLLGADWVLGPTAARPPAAGTVLALLDRQGFCLALGLLEGLGTRPGPGRPLHRLARPGGGRPAPGRQKTADPNRGGDRLIPQRPHIWRRPSRHRKWSPASFLPVNFFVTFFAVCFCNKVEATKESLP